MRRSRETIGAVVSVAAIVVGAILAVFMPAVPRARADSGPWGGQGGGLTKGAADAAYCQIAGGAGCTMAGQVLVNPANVASPTPGFAFSDNTAIGVYHPNSNRIALGKSVNAFVDVDDGANTITTVGAWTFAGSATDITTNPNEDFTIAPNGSGKVVLTSNIVNVGGELIHTNAPTSVTSGSCTAETLRAGGSEHRGEVTATCTAQTWIVLFTTTYTRAPVCTITPMNAAAQLAAKTDGPPVHTTSTTALTVTITTSTTTGIWEYTCSE